MTRYGFLSTYPPTRCGLATFTESLAGVLVRADDSSSIVRVLDVPDAHRPTLRGPHSRIVADLIADDRLSIARATSALDACDVAIVQHEYGIYGGADGEQILDVLAAVSTPTIVVLHTVLVTPTPHQRHVLTEVCLRASIVVVMTQNARDILAAHYRVDLSRVRVVPHGAPELSAQPPRHHAGKRVLTWGLISPGKGIEWGVRAIAELRDLGVPVEYVVAGQTHPKVLAHSGESYRETLGALVSELGLEGSVHLDGRYLAPMQLSSLLASTDVVLLPYDSRDQATSGVLTEAVAAGVPVVSTGFPHARELLAGGSGIVVEHEDPTAIATALRTILTDEDAARRMRDAALSGAHAASWTSVADCYRALTAGLLSTRAA